MTTAQLVFAGLDRSAIHHRAGRGRLHAIHRGVYAVGHDAIGEVGTRVAALLAVGPGGVLSHRPAASILGLMPQRSGPVDVTLLGGRRRNRDGIRMHRGGLLTSRDVIRRGLLPLTGPARTIIDLAEADEHGDFERALNEARLLRLVTEPALSEAIRRHPGRRGAARLAALLAAEAEPGFSRSRAEEILATLIDRAGLPAPLRNRRTHGFELDFFWPHARLNAEVDGFIAHSRRRNFSGDRDRDTLLASFGIQVLRFTWWQLTEKAPTVVARIAAALALRSAA